MCLKDKLYKKDPGRQSSPKVKDRDHPLVGGINIGYKSCFLHVNRLDVKLKSQITEVR